MIETLLVFKWPLIILQLILSPFLILFVLLQQGKGDDGIGSALSGGTSSSVMGTGGASRVLVKGTIFLVALFMVNSIFLAKIFKVANERSVGTSQSERLVPKTPDANKSAAGAAVNPSASPVASPVGSAPAKATSRPDVSAPPSASPATSPQAK